MIFCFYLFSVYNCGYVDVCTADGITVYVVFFIIFYSDAGFYSFSTLFAYVYYYFTVRNFFISFSCSFGFYLFFYNFLLEDCEENKEPQFNSEPFLSAFESVFFLWGFIFVLDPYFFADIYYLISFFY